MSQKRYWDAPRVLLWGLFLALVLFTIGYTMNERALEDARGKGSMAISYSSERWSTEEEAREHCSAPVAVARPATQEHQWACPD